MKKISIQLLIVLMSGYFSISYGQSNANHVRDTAIKMGEPRFANLWKVSDSIYRSEQPSEGMYNYLAGRCQVKSLLNLRPEHDDTAKMKSCSLKEYNVPMKPESIKDEQIIKALKDLIEAPKPILVHCARGSDRTGVVIAMYRIIFQNWTKEEAIKEMEDGGFGFHKGYTNIVSYIEKVDVEKMKKKLAN